VGILADEEALQPADDGLDAGAPVGLAEAGEAALCGDSDENPLVVGLDGRGANVGDPHGQLLETSRDDRGRGTSLLSSRVHQ